MGVFEDIFVKAKVALGALGEKAGQFVDVSKLNIKLAELKSDLKSEYETLGKTVYNSKKDGISKDNEINLSIAQIDNVSIQIEELKKQIASTKNQIICKSCGSQNDVGASYCAKCGAVLNAHTNVAELQKTEDDFADFDED